MSDERIGKRPMHKAKSARTARTPSSSRRARRMDDREVAQNRTLTDDERLNEFRKSFYQSVLPDLPAIPGHHVCWLTTTNPRDSIAARARLGYTPIRAEEVPGWEYASLKTGEYAGCIGVNEMVAFKVPLELYEAYMYETHHVQPLAEEQKISIDAVEELIERASREATSGDEGIKVEFEKGNAQLGKDRDVPSFEENLARR